MMSRLTHGCCCMVFGVRLPLAAVGCVRVLCGGYGVVAGAGNHIGEAGAASVAAALGSGRCGLTELDLECKWRVCMRGVCVG